MINWFKKRRINKEIVKLEKKLNEVLGDIYPSMKEIRNNAKLQSDIFSSNPNGITLLHSINGKYFERYGKKHKVGFKIEGLEIKRRDKDEYIKLPIIVTYDLVQEIEIDNPTVFWKIYDTSKIRAIKISRTLLEIKNEDEKKLKKILKEIDTELLSKIEVDDTFEIEFDSKKYYTIRDMEDGNYIGVDSKRQVFRLHHDSDEQAKLINKSINDFLINFSGNKNDLTKLFD